MNIQYSLILTIFVALASSKTPSISNYGVQNDDIQVRDERQADELSLVLSGMRHIYEYLNHLKDKFLRELVINYTFRL